jgi:hypothetical protein
MVRPGMIEPTSAKDLFKERHFDERDYRVVPAVVPYLFRAHAFDGPARFPKWRDMSKR